MPEELLPKAVRERMKEGYKFLPTPPTEGPPLPQFLKVAWPPFVERAKEYLEQWKGER